jgi:hypothetical protein
MSIRSRISAAVGAWIALTAAALAGGVAAWRDRLPGTIATHWSFSGAPNGSMPVGAFTGVPLALWAVIAVSGVAVLARGWRTRQRRGAAFSVLGAGAAFVVGLELLTIWANLDIADWHQARTLGWQLIPHLVLCAALGRVGWLLGRLGPHVEPVVPAGGELALAPDERAVWVSTVSSRVLSALGGVAIVAALVTGITGTGWPITPIAAVTGLACLAFSSARVNIDERGVRTALGPLRWPVRTIKLDRVASARPEVRSAWEVGGWGYRARPGTTAIMLRSGECLVLHLVSGREFVISVDHAERGAELLNALLTERSAR